MTVTDHSKATADASHSHSHSHGAPAQSRASRPSSFVAGDFAVPRGREEEWRFSPLKSLAPLFSENLAGQPLAITSTAPQGVSVRAVPAADRVAIASPPADRAAAVAWESAVEATEITIDANVELAEPVFVKLDGAGQEPTANHLQIVAGENSVATVVLDHGGDAVVTQHVEIVARDGSQLTVVALHDWDETAVHASSHRARIGKDANLRHAVVTLGGKVVRVTPDAEFTGEGGSVEMFGLYFADSGQHQEHRLFVDHGMPRCRSRVTYKGALAGESARTVWIGDVLIRAAAEGTDPSELNRNLVLTDGARADSVPNLEIETGEIEGAGHASATGRFDDEQLFYLMSRGVAEPEARRLVVRGFFADLIHEIGVAAVEDRLIAAIDAELEAADE